MTPGDDDPPANEGERLIRAAWTVLERTGFEGFKVASVIRAAGSSTKRFYRFFESKDAMLLALLLDETKRAGTRLTARLRGVDSPTAAVELWIATMIGSAARPDLAARARLFSSLGQIGARFPEQVRGVTTGDERAARGGHRSRTLIGRVPTRRCAQRRRPDHEPVRRHTSRPPRWLERHRCRGVHWVDAVVRASLPPRDHVARMKFVENAVLLSKHQNPQ